MEHLVALCPGFLHHRQRLFLKHQALALLVDPLKLFGHPRQSSDSLLDVLVDMVIGDSGGND